MKLADYKFEGIVKQRVTRALRGSVAPTYNSSYAQSLINSNRVDATSVITLESGDEFHNVENIRIRTFLGSDELTADFNVNLTDDARQLLIEKGNGDLRATLNSLELAVLSTKQELKNEHKDDSTILITQKEMADSIQMKIQNFDASGDGHYDLVSAFQKSIRGSDTDAALHYLARLIESGDLISICRRLTVIAYEDIGLANPGYFKGSGCGPMQLWNGEEASDYYN